MSEPTNLELPERGVGKCCQSHIGAYGFPSRPSEPYGFCSTCGEGMVWACPSCTDPLPEDPEELEAARFCRKCGTSYFEVAGAAPK